MDTNQQMRYSQAEIALIQQFTASRPDAVLVLRNHFLQLPLTDEEKVFINGLTTDFLSVLEKMMTPDLSRDVPLNQQATLYSILTELESVNPDAATIHIKANDIIVAFFKQQFEALTGGEQPIELATLPLADENDSSLTDFNRLKSMIAFNKILTFADGRLSQLTYLSVKPVVPSEDELAKQAAANSSK